MTYDMSWSDELCGLDSTDLEDEFYDDLSDYAWSHQAQLENGVIDYAWRL